MTASNVILDIRNLSKTYSGLARPAVADLTLTVKAGEFVTFLGPSGSGKTTTLQMLSGFIRASSGTVTLNGTDILSMPTYRRGLGMVFQNYALFPHMTVASNVGFPLRMRGVSPAEAQHRVEDVLHRVRMQDFANRYPHELSGGQQQRVAIARAIIYNPPVLLMDEPLSALDKRLRGELQLEIMRLHKELGMTVIFVTHDQEEALALSDRIAVFSQGRLEGIGSPQALYKTPPNLFVAQFLGDSNVIPGTLKHGSSPTVDSAIGPIPVSSSLGPEGQPGHAMIRPESIEIREGTNVEAGTFHVRATVSAVIYEGASRNVLFRTASGVELLVKEQARVFSEIGIGMEHALCWHARDVIWFPI